MGLLNCFKPMPFSRLRFGCFLLLSIVALSPWHLEAQKTETFSFDWQAMEKAIGAVFIEKYGKEIMEFERQEIVALIPMEKIDLYMGHFGKGLESDIGMTIIEDGECRWLETAESTGSQYRQVFKLGYNQGSLNASMKRKVYWKVEWQAFIKEWLKWIAATERSKAEALLPKKKVNAYMKSFTRGLYSDTGISKKRVRRRVWLGAAFRYGFHYQRLFENGYREGLVQSVGDSLKYMKKIEWPIAWIAIFSAGRKATPSASCCRRRARSSRRCR